MSNIFALLGRLTVIFIAYLAALIAGGLFFTLALTGVLEPGATASPPEDWLTILPLAGVVTATAGSLAFIPFLAAMFASVRPCARAGQARPPIAYRGSCPP